MCRPMPTRGKLKALLNAQRNHDLALYIGFVNLVKKYNTANHKLLIDILCCCGIPPKFVTAIKTIYRNNTCMLKIENEEQSHRNPAEARGMPRGKLGAQPLPLLNDSFCRDP